MDVFSVLDDKWGPLAWCNCKRKGSRHDDEYELRSLTCTTFLVNGEAHCRRLSLSVERLSSILSNDNSSGKINDYIYTMHTQHHLHENTPK